MIGHGRRPSPVNAFLRLNERLWGALPASWTRRAPLSLYARFLHHLVLSTASRRQYFGTFFFRNRAQLSLLPRLLAQKEIGSRVRMAVLGCSNGAELYSVLWNLRRARPDLQLTTNAVDISADVLSLAEGGVYSLAASELVGEPIFARTTSDEMQAMFDVDPERQQARVKPWLKEGINWRLHDVRAPDIVELLGAQDLVLANNFLCHMRPAEAEGCLRNIARLVAPGGHLVVSGVDLDVRVRVAAELGWRPVTDLLLAIHDGDPSLRKSWPLAYWSVEPLNSTRPDWHVRYASVFQVGSAPTVTRGPRQPRLTTCRAK